MKIFDKIENELQSVFVKLVISRGKTVFKENENMVTVSNGK